MNLSGKKILFICPKFHKYEFIIKKIMEDSGGEVIYFPERSYGYDFNIVNNFFPKKLESYQKKHYNKIMDKITNEKFDFLFVIRGYKLPIHFLRNFKKKNPNCVSIMYQWDSQKTNTFSHLISEFDKVSTFDFEDSDNLNLKYIPLFYTQDVLNHKKNKNSSEFDFFFMGFFFEERYEALLKFREYCYNNGYTLKSFLYMPFSTRVKYFLKGRKLDLDVVSFKHMDREEYLKTLSVSKIMVDVSNSKQTGLAMRVIESLGCDTKVLTNNKNFIRDSKVAASGMIDLFDLSNINVNKQFLYSEPNIHSNAVFSIEEWLNEIFSEY